MVGIVGDYVIVGIFFNDVVIVIFFVEDIVLEEVCVFVNFVVYYVGDSNIVFNGGVSDFSDDVFGSCEGFRECGCFLMLVCDVVRFEK